MSSDTCLAKNRGSKSSIGVWLFLHLSIKIISNIRLNGTITCKLFQWLHAGVFAAPQTSPLSDLWLSPSVSSGNKRSVEQRGGHIYLGWKFFHWLWAFKTILYRASWGEQTFEIVSMRDWMSFMGSVKNAFSWGFIWKPNIGGAGCLPGLPFVMPESREGLNWTTHLVCDGQIAAAGSTNGALFCGKTHLRRSGLCK